MLLLAEASINPWLTIWLSPVTKASLRRVALLPLRFTVALGPRVSTASPLGPKAVEFPLTSIVVSSSVVVNSTARIPLVSATSAFPVKLAPLASRAREAF